MTFIDTTMTTDKNVDLTIDLTNTTSVSTDEEQSKNDFKQLSLNFGGDPFVDSRESVEHDTNTYVRSSEDNFSDLREDESEERSDEDSEESSESKEYDGNIVKKFLRILADAVKSKNISDNLDDKEKAKLEEIQRLRRRTVLIEKFEKLLQFIPGIGKAIENNTVLQDYGKEVDDVVKPAVRLLLSPFHISISQKPHSAYFSTMKHYWSDEHHGHYGPSHFGPPHFGHGHYGPPVVAGGGWWKESAEDDEVSYLDAVKTKKKLWKQLIYVKIYKKVLKLKKKLKALKKFGWDPWDSDESKK